MEFWSTVTFRACDDEEQADLGEVMTAVGEMDPAVVREVVANGAIVVKTEHARALAEALQQATLDERRDHIRRGLIKALAFNQHYIHNSSGWVPADVAKRHHHD